MKYDEILKILCDELNGATNHPLPLGRTAEKLKKAIDRAFKAKDKAVEPLEKLADRKGYIRIQYDRYVDGTFSIYIGFGKLQEKEFYGSTYASCEDVTRAYLEALPDKGEGV